MGYSLSTPCKSAKARDRMAKFLRSELVPFSKLVADAPELPELEKVSQVHLTELRYDPTQWICVGGELAYGSGASKIGFNFSSSGFYGLWMYALCAWMAFRVGRRRGLNKLSMVGHADQRVAYTTYDHEPYPVLTKADIASWTPASQEQARWQWLVNDLGVREVEDADHKAKRLLGDDAPHEFMIRQVEIDRLVTAIVERELRRLDYLWDEFVDREGR